MRKLLALVISCAAGLTSYSQVRDSLHHQAGDSVVAPRDTVEIPTRDTLSIVGVGDIMMGSNYPPPGLLPADDGKQLMKEVEPILRNADVTFGNLEGVLLTDGGMPKKCKNPSVCYAFRSPTHYVENLSNAGFDLMSLANNHAGDFGDSGRTSTMQALDTAGIGHAGQLQRPFALFTNGGVAFGLVAFAPNTNCIDINDIDLARALVMKADSTCDVLIVSFHGGAEGPQHQHVPRTNEVYYGEDRGNVHHFAHAMIDAGADIVFGHGPHVTRAVEVYQDRFIAYSLGNFCTYGGMNVNGVNGLAPIIRVLTDRKGRFYEALIVPTYQQVQSPVRVDPEKRVIKKIQELTKEDFPDNPITIDDNGWIKSSTIPR